MSKADLNRKDVLDLLHPELHFRVKKVLHECHQKGWQVGVFETLRSEDRQRWLFSNGRFPMAKTHLCLGLGAIFQFKTPKGNWTTSTKYPWEELETIIENCGLIPQFYCGGLVVRLQVYGNPKIHTLYKLLKTECDSSIEVFWNKLDPQIMRYAQKLNAPTLMTQKERCKPTRQTFFSRFLEKISKWFKK